MDWWHITFDSILLMKLRLIHLMCCQLHFGWKMYTLLYSWEKYCIMIIQSSSRIPRRKTYNISGFNWNVRTQWKRKCIKNFPDSSIECLNFISSITELNTFKDLNFFDCFSMIYDDIIVYHNIIVIGFYQKQHLANTKINFSSMISILLSNSSDFINNSDLLSLSA